MHASIITLLLSAISLPTLIQAIPAPSNAFDTTANNLPVYERSGPSAHSDVLEAVKRSEEALEKRDNWNPLTNEINALNAANTNNDRYKILPPDGLFFDFLDAPSFGGGGKDGGVVLADNTNFPGVIGQGMAMLFGVLGPCGMVAPHIHPRATEYLLNVAGPPLLGGNIPENGAPYYSGLFGPGNFTVLPMGSVHFVANTGCDPAVIVASFNAESPGVLLFSNAYQSIDTETIDALFGGVGATVYDSKKIPANVMLGRNECLSRCNIDRNTFDISSVSKRDLMNNAYSKYLKSVNYNYNDDGSDHWI